MLHVLLLLLLLLQLLRFGFVRFEWQRNCNDKDGVLLTLSDRLEVSTETIWRELSDRLRQFVQSRVASHADADDILQQVFLRIHQKLGDLKQESRLESWVFQITRNAIVDFLRSKPKSDPATMEELAEPSDTDSNKLNSEIAGCVAALVACLPEDQRRAVTAYELHRMSQQDIAAQESISLSGAKSRIQRGRQTLATILHECCRFELDRRGNVIDVERLSGSSSTAVTCECSVEGCDPCG